MYCGGTSYLRSCISFSPIDGGNDMAATSNRPPPPQPSYHGTGRTITPIDAPIPACKSALPHPPLGFSISAIAAISAISAISAGQVLRMYCTAVELTIQFARYTSP